MIAHRAHTQLRYVCLLCRPALRVIPSSTRDRPSLPSSCPFALLNYFLTSATSSQFSALTSSVFEALAIPSPTLFIACHNGLALDALEGAVQLLRGRHRRAWRRVRRVAHHPFRRQ